MGWAWPALWCWLGWAGRYIVGCCGAGGEGRGEANPLGQGKWRRQCCAILGRVTQDGSGQGGARRVRSWALRVLSGGDRAGWAGRKRAGWGGVMFGESGRRGAGLGWVGLGWDGIKQGEVEQGGTGQISETLSTTKSRRMAQQKIPNCCSKITFFCIAVNSPGRPGYSLFESISLRAKV